jgi:hypothetical protein
MKVVPASRVPQGVESRVQSPPFSTSEENSVFKSGGFLLCGA